MNLLLTETPYVYAVESEWCDNCCWTCLKTNIHTVFLGNVPNLYNTRVTLSRCSKCKFARYCSKECQQAGWMDHKQECKALQKCGGKMPGTLVRFCGRLWFKKDDPIGPDVRSLGDLVNHTQEFIQDPEFISKYFALFAETANYLNLSGKEKECFKEWLLDAQCTRDINGFKIHGWTRIQTCGLATGLYLNLSTLDHSCNPTARVMFDGHRALLVKIGGELGEQAVDWKKETICYAGKDVPAMKRKADLKKRYFFDCKCDACEDPQRDLLMFALQCLKCGKDAVPRSISDRKVYDCLSCGHTFQKDVAVIEERLFMMVNKDKLLPLQYLYQEFHRRSLWEMLSAGLKMAMKAGLSWSHIRRSCLADEAFTLLCHCRKSEYPEMLKYFEQLDLISYVWNNMYPADRGESMAALARAYIECGRLEEAKVCYDKALEYIAMSHSCEHSLYATIKAKKNAVFPDDFTGLCDMLAGVCM